MKFIVAIILLYLVITFLNWSTKHFSGDGKGKRQGDERQKKIFRDATTSSWQAIIFYSLIQLINPSVLDIILNLRSNHTSINILNNGGDILLVGLLGYIIGYLNSYFRNT
ncbi:hypothetical protein [Neobacillus sp. PS3-40]|jgi:hypothetical protein|uniref:hypothetical protein n=1 Tax=Neobacillus sp. PS3-40 TaxID=3070679 RepID=UPI0027E1E7FE|nr:hypothetical protein [Neobacillus sp. PS3-40]WML45427.1 hypothetical protein RCG20_05865 [Neobacillus sp. PS3-40]